MEQNGESHKLLCRSGCGFYGTQTHDGMCSKCYKDALKRKQQNPSPTQLHAAPITPAGSAMTERSLKSVRSVGQDTATLTSTAVSPTSSATLTTFTTSPSTATATSSTKAYTPASPDKGDIDKDELSADTSANVGAVDASTGTSEDTINTSVDASTDTSVDNTSTDASCSSPSPSEERERKPAKKKRCDTCKKKVGLTGFKCRCEGLYCSTHRYSDKHDCTFDYHEMAQEQIRKSNPVVVGAKVNKI